MGDKGPLTDPENLGRGGFAFHGPWGTSVAANLTSHPDGLADYSDDELKAMITKGAHADGSPMMPPMPYGYLAGMTPEDLDAVILYLRSLPPLPDAPAAATGTAPGPSAKDIEAASEMSTEERDQMIRSMVQGLSERLATEGGSASEWARLIGALGVLGDTEQARNIWTEAQGIFAADQQAMEMLRQAAQSAGVAE